MRRWTRRFERARVTTSAAEVLGDVYTVVLTLAVTGAIIAAAAARFGAGAAMTTHEVPVANLAPQWVAVLAAVAALAATAGLLARLGPVSLSGPESAWWLPLPGDRRSLLVPAALRWPAVCALAGLLGGAVLALVLAPAPGAGPVLAMAALGAGAGAATAGALAVGQTLPRWRRVRATVADTALALVPVAAVVLTLVPTTPPGLPPLAAPLAAACAAGAALAAWARLRRLPLVPDAELRERGAVTGQLHGAALSMDTRELGRALSQVATPSRRRRSARLAWLRGRGGRRRPGLALATADALLLARSGRHVVQLAVGACLPLAALLVPEPAPLAVVLCVTAGAWIAALATAEGARWAEMAPALDALLPLSERAVRRWRLAVPVAAMLAWSFAVFAVVAWRYGDLGGWLALGALSAPVWAAGVVRSAYRASPDWSGPLIVTPMGAFPPGMATFASIGPDVAILGAAPVAVALLVGEVAPALLVAQVLVSALALGIAARPPKPKPGPDAR
ncbi:DUF6297 family protein [Georgenia sp. MJ206]|uniref:DUF6297 family protein n=1 Tax=Georgenia wangjunii TaxID=3117730 RepID=UPI002F2608ED